MENHNNQDLADRIAFLLQANATATNDSLRSSLSEINQRLDEVESNIAARNPKSKIQNPKSNHFSQEKFTDLEELADETTNGLKDEKACPYEPTGKPCDYCAMCNSRGF